MTSSVASHILASRNIQRKLKTSIVSNEYPLGSMIVFHVLNLHMIYEQINLCT